VLVGGRELGAAFADDYVLLAAALLDVFELTADPAWLTDAVGLMDEVERAFSDGARGGYYLSAERHERLFLREKPDYDGPVPSVSSVAAMTWLRLAALTDDDRFRQRAETTVRAFSRTLASSPLGLEHMLLALDWATDAPREIVIVVPEGRGAFAPAARPLLDVLGKTFAPNSVLVVTSTADVGGELGRRIPWLREKALRAGRATAYVCENGTCQLPTNEPGAFASELARARPYP
jgi:uncharacterized protein YyaL (SSP411 family)